MREHKKKAILALALALCLLLFFTLGCSAARLLSRAISSAQGGVGSSSSSESASALEQSESQASTEAGKSIDLLPKRVADQLPKYPGAKRDEAKEAALSAMTGKLGTLGAQFESAQVRIYQTPDKPGKVVDFYLSAMQKEGWELHGRLAGEEGGFISWERTVGDLRLETVALIGAEQQGEKSLTLIVLGVKYAGGEGRETTTEGQEEPQGEGTTVQGQFVQPPAGQGLLSTPSISLGVNGWQLWLQGGSREAGHNEVRMVEDSTYMRVVEFYRTSEKRDGGAAGIYQSLDIDVSPYKHLYVFLVGKVISEMGGNIANRNPRWFPEGAVQVRVKYLGLEGKELEWYHGFYAHEVDGADKEHFTLVKPNEWFSYTSPDLLALANPPAQLTELRLYGFGWAFQGQVAKIDLIGSP